MFQLFGKIKIDTWVIILLSFLMTYNVFNMKHWNKDNKVIAWDVISYYAYLPATFIYGDYTLEKPNLNYQKLDHIFWYEETNDGKKVFKTTMGMSLLYAPFFFTAHVYSLIRGLEIGGYTPIYKFAICISTLFYFFIGLFFLRNVLRKHFDNVVVALTLFFIVMATNLYYYVVIGVGLTHSYLFCLLSIFIYSTEQWYIKPALKWSLINGFIFGLMVLIRPTMIFASIFFILHGITSFGEVKKRTLLYRKNISQLVILVFASLFVWIPQLLYWKTTTGSYLYYSYTDERFFFLDPQIINCLFSFRKGWLLYAPIMLFSIFGLFLSFRKRCGFALSSILTTSIYFYVISCWWDWWYGGSFGFRAMIEMYPILSFGMAFILQYFMHLSLEFRVPIISFMTVLMLFNLFQTRQAHEGLLHHDSMTKNAYFKILFKLQHQITREEVKPLLKSPNYGEAKKGNRDH